ncbi:hypothetical protein [Ruminococcus sp. Marseille-P6503]|uniref:hypothetical protein n=1 Tax=Ruminococcus sp. Marseille-P6503 TaxID=2364796 RepID=UPI000F52AFF4|nr:hypothetical protein [Ruminococcus sp. Marseille-P6503]
MNFKIKKASLALFVTLMVNAALVCVCSFAFNSDFAGTVCAVSVTMLWLFYVLGFCRKKN